MIYSNSPKNLFHSTVLDPRGLHHGFGTKAFGDGRDISTLKHYLNTHAPAYTHIIQPQQTHSTNVHIVSAGDLIEDVIRAADCDGLVTKERNVVLTVVTADCVPIIYYDPVSAIIGISHQGWKGTRDRAPAFVIEKMIALGSTPANIICAMGPAINTCCYHMDLYTINQQTLQSAGVSAKHIDIFPFCTCCDAERFYSYRREGKINGEMIHFVMMS